MTYKTKKTICVEAIVWDPTKYADISLFMNRTPILKGKLLEIETLEGVEYASPGDYIVYDGNNFYIEKADFFNENYIKEEV